MTNGDWKVHPAVWRRVNDIKRKDLRVAVVGKIIDMKKDILVLDDGSGKLTVRFGEETKEALNSVRIGDQIRVFGTVLPLEKEIELNGEIIQKYDVDKQLFNKVYDIIYK